MNGANSILEEVAGGSDYVAFGAERLSVRGYLRRFLFSDERINERVDTLSGGERSRVLLAKILRCGGNFLILDEPTNDLDLATLRVLEEAIIAFEGTVLVVSHDRFFLDRVATKSLPSRATGECDLPKAIGATIGKNFLPGPEAAGRRRALPRSAGQGWQAGSLPRQAAQTHLEGGAGA